MCAVYVRVLLYVRVYASTCVHIYKACAVQLYGLHNMAYLYTLNHRCAANRIYTVPVVLLSLLLSRVDRAAYSSEILLVL